MPMVPPLSKWLVEPKVRDTSLPILLESMSQDLCERSFSSDGSDRDNIGESLKNLSAVETQSWVSF